MDNLNMSPETINSNTHYETGDFALTVFLYYSGVKLSRVIPIPDDRNKFKKKFIFEKPENFQELLDYFISSDPTIKLKKFLHCQKAIKKLIYENN